jgi:hypothetical protein
VHTAAPFLRKQQAPASVESVAYTEKVGAAPDIYQINPLPFICRDRREKCVIAAAA